MKHLKHLFTALMLVCCLTATAHNFKVNGIYYNILSETDKIVEVTRGANRYTGSVVIPQSVTYNGSTYSVTSIGNQAFAWCEGLTSIEIPNSVTNIGNHAFYDCTGLTSIEIGNSVTSIGLQAFAYCSGLTSIEIPNSVTSIGSSAFQGCSGLTSIEIPNSVTSIGSSAFEGCTGLISIVIPNSVTSIGNQAFAYCSGLTSIVIPNSVTSVGDYAFAYCSGFTSIIVESGNMYYDSRDNCNAIIETATNTLLAGCKNTMIPNDVTSIGDGAFYGCSGLISIVIPNSVTSIGNQAFAYCSGLTSIVIPNSVTSIREYAFYGCSGLTSIIVESGNMYYDSRDNCNAIIETATNTLLAGCQNTIIPNDVTSIGNQAFYGCTGLTSITIPNSVTFIGSGAFYGTGLTSIVIGNSVTSIEWDAFEACTELETVYNFSNLTFSKGSYDNGYIAYYADKVYNLPEGFIENDFVLGNVNGVNTLIYYLGNDTEPTLPANYKGENYAIGVNAFEGNTTITSITIPNSVTNIGESAFNNCTGLTRVEICNGVTSIGNYAFEGCSNIETLYISSTIESIGIKAFDGCDKIKEIKVGAEKPIRGDENIFTDAVYDNATLYIPNGTKSLYEKREPWNIFFYIVEMDFTGIDEVFEDVKGENSKVEGIFDLNGRVVENPTKGIYIIDGKKCWVSESND